MAEENWFIDGAKIIDIGVIHNLKVGLVAGQVDIVGHDEPGTRIDGFHRIERHLQNA